MKTLYFKLLMYISVANFAGFILLTLTNNFTFAAITTGFFTAWSISIHKDEVKQLKLKDLSA